MRSLRNKAQNVIVKLWNLLPSGIAIATYLNGFLKRVGNKFDVCFYLTWKLLIEYNSARGLLSPLRSLRIRALNIFFLKKSGWPIFVVLIF